MTTQVTLSALVQTPTRVIALLEEGDVVLTRREGENLRLTVDSRATRQAASLSHATEVVAQIARVAPEIGVEVLRIVFPWVEILSSREREQFAEEYLSTLRAAASLNSFAVLDSVENAWRATAELKADSELRARIQDRIDSAGPVRASRPARRREKRVLEN